MPSEVDILKTNAAAKKGTGVSARDTEVTWPKPQFVSCRCEFADEKGPSTTIDNVTDKEGADGFVVPAGSMFPLVCSLIDSAADCRELRYRGRP